VPPATSTRQERERELVAATRGLFDERGMQDAPVEEIAKAAGIAEGTIFRVFESKDALIDATVHDAFDNTGLIAEIAAVDRALPVRERLAAAVAVMQVHLRGVFSLMSVLHASGQPMRPPTHDEDAHRRREEATAELDAAFVDLLGDDAAQLRVGATTFVGYLRMLTLSSVHPMLGGAASTPEELVDVLLDGALARASEEPTRTPTSGRA